MDDYRIQKGEDGERYVGEILNKVLSKMDFYYKLVQNTYLPFESVYGKNGFISAEFDFTIFTPFYVYIIEVKNESYANCDYSAMQWELKDGTKVSNAINQNHTHKEVFCSEMNIRLDNVITIEILLENDGVVEEYTSYPNDHVFGKKSLEENLLHILSSENNSKFECQRLYDRFKKTVDNKGITKEKHIKILDRTEIIETRIRNVIGYIPFKRTDIIKCNCCTAGNLRFLDKKYESNQNSKRVSTHYFLGCSSYYNKSIECNQKLIYVDKNKKTDDFQALIPIHIEERNNWGDEQVNQTVLDEINELKSRIKSLNEENEIHNREIEKLKNSLERVQQENKYNEIERNKFKNEVITLKNDNECKVKELSLFKRLVGKIYIKTQ